MISELKFKSRGLLLISYLDYPYCVGLSKRISGLTRVLEKNRIRVKILAPITRENIGFDDKLSSNLIIERIDLRRFTYKNPDDFFSKFVVWLLFSFIAVFRVLKDCIKNQYLVQYQSVFSILPALAVKFILRVQIVGDDVFLTHPLLDSLVFNVSNILITPSMKSYSFAKQLGKSVLYVPNGVVINHELTTPVLNPIILFVGSFSFTQNLKAIEQIVKLAVGLGKEAIVFKIVIVGGPLNYAKHLFNTSVVKEGKVSFLGRISDKKLLETYNSSFIGVLPFFSDTPLLGGQRTKALEFFANGLLVISGPEGVKGIDGLKPNEHYLLAKSLDDMCRIIDECLSKPEKYLNIAAAGTKYVSENFSWDALTKDYCSFIQSYNSANFT